MSLYLVFGHLWLPIWLLFSTKLQRWNIIQTLSNQQFICLINSVSEIYTN